MFTELLIAVSSFIHIAVYLKRKEIKYRILYYESYVLLIIGLSGWISSWILLEPKDLGRALFTLYSGQWYFPVQPIDLIFLGLGLLATTTMLDFLTRSYDMDRKSMLAILPWTIVGQYRYLHEFAWTYQYWITMNVKAGYFSDIIPPPDALGGGIDWPVALLTHSYALLFTVFTIFNLVVVLRESAKKKTQQ